MLLFAGNRTAQVTMSDDLPGTKPYNAENASSSTHKQSGLNSFEHLNSHFTEHVGRLTKYDMHEVVNFPISPHDVC